MTEKPKSRTVQDSLLAAIQRKTPGNAIAAQQVSEDMEDQRRTKATAPARRIGKPAQFWFQEEDRRLIRELAAWLAGQGIRLTDSLVIRAALRTARTGEELLKACIEAAELDGRRRPQKLN